jgi:glycosyltransferase involved in cell wall biosynthesis
VFEKPKISVILTTFNSAKRLQRTLDSVISQNGNGTDFDIELIVVDDCSTDHTQDLLRRNHIEFYTTGKNSGGPNKGRNIGLEKATGSYICLLDHDDTWEADKLSSQLKVAQFYPVVSTAYRTVDTYEGQVITGNNSTSELNIYQYNQAFLLRLIKCKRGQRAYLSTLMIHSSLKHIRFEEHFGVVDYDWYLRLLENQSSAEISRPLMTRYIHGGNLSLNKDYRNKDYCFTLACLESYESRYPREVALARKRLNGSIARYFYLTGEMQAARAYFKKSFWDVKTAMYYFTSYYGNDLIKKHFRVFG